MSDLNELFKVISEGKKHYEENDPKGKKLKEVKEHARTDFDNIFSQLVSMKEELESELVVLEAKQEQIIEASDPELNTIKVPETVELPTPEERSIGTKYDVDRYLKTASFQQPDPDTVSKDVDDIRAKIKFLEQAIGRIAVTGPGSGEVNFRYLDDVNRSTMTDSNNNWVLEYDSATKKVKFTTNIGHVDSIDVGTLDVTGDAHIVGTLQVDDTSEFNDSVTVNGDLTVNGDITYINTTVLDVTDKNITIAKGATGAAAADGAGLSVDGANAHITYKYVGDAWEFDKNTVPSANYSKNLGATGFQWNQVYANNANLKSIKLNTAGPQDALVPGMIAWNPDEDCVDIAQNDGTILQVGLEQYIRVHNHTASAITNGTVVMFAGVENTNAVAMPIIGKYIADSAASPLFLIGVLTGDIVAGGIGRATTFGYVRNLDTTGASVGETWVQGDLLWGHPTVAGALTKVRPTAPNVATSIAAVVKVGTTDGQLLVRPTIWPRLYYGDWYDDANQTAALANTAYPVKLYHEGPTSGFTLVNNQDIKALNAGRYNFEFSLQLTSSNSSLARVWIWYRKNGQDAPNSATVVTIRENGGKLAPSWNFPVLMNTNDTFTLMWATESTNVSLEGSAAGAFHPSIPSVILTVSQTNL